MSRVEDTTVSPSYFWSCLTVNDECPFFSNVDPKLYYFGFGILALYGAFLMMVLGDLSFFWSLDKLQQQVDYYINLVRTKVRRVQMDQRRLMSTQERTEKQLKRSQDCKRMVTALRGALMLEDPHPLTMLTSTIVEDHNARTGNTWSDVTTVIDF